MTLAYAAERRLRPRVHEPFDYDDSLVPGQIVASIMHLPHVTAREDRELGLILRWSYGSAFGLWHGTLRRRGPGAVGERSVRRHADVRHLHAVPVAGSYAAAMALADRCPRDKHRHACRLRLGRSRRRRRHPTPVQIRMTQSPKQAREYPHRRSTICDAQRPGATARPVPLACTVSRTPAARVPGGGACRCWARPTPPLARSTRRKDGFRRRALGESGSRGLEIPPLRRRVQGAAIRLATAVANGSDAKCPKSTKRRRSSMRSSRMRRYRGDAASAEPLPCMEGDTGGATAVFYACRSEVGADRAPADDWSSSEAGVRWTSADTRASRSKQSRTSPRRGRSEEFRECPHMW